MVKLTIIGAGSTVFTKKIVVDLLNIEKFKSIEIALMDIDEKRLEKTYEVLMLVAKKINAKPLITKHTNRKEALLNANFVQTTIQVGGYKPSTIIDFAIPKKYGLNQTIADTLGLGGIMRGLRTIPVLLDIAQDIMEICPNTLWLQYVNPMCSNMIAINKVYPEINSIGLCHSVQSTAEMLAKDLNENINDINYLCAGINHMAFYQKFEKKSTGENLYPKLISIAEKILNDEIVSSRTKQKEFYTDKKLHEKMQKISWYGINRDAKKLDILDPLPHNPDFLGLKANMNDIVATLACTAIDYLDTALKKRYNYGTIYRDELKSLSKLTLINYKNDRKPNYQIFPVHVENRIKFAEFMWNKGIQVNINNRRNDLYEIFGGLQNDLINLDKADNDVILIPLHNNLSEFDIHRIIDSIKEYDKK